jgi:hypothetical protein
LKGNFCLGLIKFVEGRGGAGGGLEGATMIAGSGWPDLLLFVLQRVGHRLIGSLLAMGCGVVLVLATLYHFFDLILEVERHIGFAMCVLFIVHYLLPVQKNKGVFD